MTKFSRFIDDIVPYLPIGLFAFIGYMIVNVYPTWRLVALLEDALWRPPDGGVSLSSSASDGSPEHFSLLGVWIGLGLAVVCAPTMFIPLITSHRLPKTQFVLRVISRVGYTFEATMLFMVFPVFIWELINFGVPALHGDCDHGNGALVSLCVILGVALVYTVYHVVLAATLFSRHIEIHSPKVKRPFTIVHISGLLFVYSFFSIAPHRRPHRLQVQLVAEEGCAEDRAGAVRRCCRLRGPL